MARIRTALRRTGKTLAWIVGGVLALLLILVLAFLVPAVRQSLADRALEAATAALPGDFRIAEASWPRADRIELTDVLWTAEGDTLLVIDEGVVELEYSPLLRRDLILESVRVAGLRADLPAIQRHAGGRDTTTAPSGDPFFPRAGSLPGAPSVAVERLHADAGRVVIDTTTVLTDLEVAGRFSLLSGEAPMLRIDELLADERGRGWRLASGELLADLQEGVFAGELDGRAGPDQPFHLDLSSAARDSFVLRLGRSPGSMPPQAPGVRLAGRLSRSGARLDGVDIDGLLLLPAAADMDGWPALAPVAAAAPGLPAIRTGFSAEASFRPALDVRLEASLKADRWLHGALVRARYAGADVEVDTLTLDLPDLDLRGRLALDDEQATGAASLQVRGMRWLTEVRPDAAGPDSLRADLEASVRGPRAGPEFRVSVVGDAIYAGHRVDSLAVRAEVPEGEDRVANVSYGLAARDLLVAGAAAVRRTAEGGLAVRLTPVHLDTTTTVQAAARRASRGERSGRVALPPDGPIRLEGVRLEGAAGELTVDGQVRTGEGPVSGRFDLDWRWPRVPTLLVQRLGLGAGPADTLGDSWRRDDPYHLRLDVELGTAAAGAGQRIAARGDLRLPGPRDLVGLLPASALADTLGPFEGSIAASATMGAGDPLVMATLDLGATAWMDTARVHARGQGDRLEIETLRLDLQSLDLTATATRTGERWDGRAELAMHDARPLRLVAPEAFADTEASATVTARFGGTADRPDLTADLEASWSDDRADVPRIAGSVVWNQEDTRAVLRAPEPSRIGPADLDSLRVHYRRADDADGSLPAVVALEAGHADWGVTQEIHLARPDGRWLVEGRRWRIRVDERQAELAHPFRLAYDPASQRVDVDSLALEGDLGSLDMTAQMSPEGVRGDVRLRVDPPQDSPTVSVPPSLWPSAVSMDLHAAASDSFVTTLQFDGLALREGGDEATARLRLGYGGHALAGRWSIAADDDSVLTGGVDLPVDMALYPPRAALRDRDVSAWTRLRRLVVPADLVRRYLPVGEPHPVAVDGRLLLRGPAAGPSVLVEADASLAEWPELDDYRLRLAALGGPAGALRPALTDSARRLGDDAPPLEIPTDEGGFSAAVSLDRGGEGVLVGSVRYPLEWSLTPPEVRLDEDAPYRLAVDSDGLDLDHIDALLPAGVDLEGRLQVHVRSEGVGRDPDLEGRLSSDGMQVHLADGTWVEAEADVELTGTGLDPRLEGEIVLNNGNIVIPDKDKVLLPTDGEAALWQSRHRRVVVGHPDPSRRDRVSEVVAAADSVRQHTTSAAAPTDSAATGTAPDRRGAEADSATDADQPLEVQLDIALDIPTGLRLTGRGLDVMFAGELRLAQELGEPVIVGSLEATQGRFRMLGRTFTVEEGFVEFFGDQATNPALDLTLATSIDEYRFLVIITGRAQSPTLTLESEPSMPEGDIMSYLVFGRPIEDLENEQLGLVQRRTMDLAASFGISQLESLSQDLGVDMLTIRQSRGPDAGASLVVGKYLSSRALLKYEQSLAERSSFLLNLEYYLSPHFMLETLLGQQNPSGVEFTWTTDY